MQHQHEESATKQSVTQELQTLVVRLTPQEQYTLKQMIDNVRQAPLVSSQEFDSLALIHHSLKADPAFFEESDLTVEEVEEDSVDNEVGESDEDVVELYKEYPKYPAIALPSAVDTLYMPLSQVLTTRASRYEYHEKPLDLQTISTLLHYAAGISRWVETPEGEQLPMRMAPSAGSLQPVNVYIIVNNVIDLSPGVYYYAPLGHELQIVLPGNVSTGLRRCSIQEFVADVPAIVVLTCSVDRVQWCYGDRAYRSVHLDAGVMCQNLYLVATALELAGCAIFGFFEDRLQQLLQIDNDCEIPTLLFPIGYQDEDE